MPEPTSVKVTESETFLFAPYRCMLQVSCFLISVFIKLRFIMDCAGQDSAQYFNKPDFTASFGLAMMGSALMFTVVTYWVFPTVKHSHKLLFSTFFRTSAYFLMYLAFTVEDLELGYWLNIAASVIFGSFSSLDHTIFVGFLKNFPPTATPTTPPPRAFLGSSSSFFTWPANTWAFL